MMLYHLKNKALQKQYCTILQPALGCADGDGVDVNDVIGDVHHRIQAYQTMQQKLSDDVASLMLWYDRVEIASQIVFVSVLSMMAGRRPLHKLDDSCVRLLA